MTTPSEYPVQDSQPTPGQFSYQQTPGQPAQPQFGQPGQFGQMPFNQFNQPQFGQAPGQFGQPGFGGWQRSSWPGGSGLPFGLSGLLLGLGWGGRYSKIFWAIRIIAILIALGVILYVGFVNHHWVITCHTDCDTGGD